MKTDTKTPADDSTKIEELRRVEGGRFDKNLEAVIAESEEMRLNRMKQHRTRSFITMNFSIFSVLVGVTGFGWFFLMEAVIVPALVILVGSFVPILFVNKWASLPLKAYIKDHKNVFMPKLAKALNGLEFHPKRGVGSKILSKLAILPAHDRYEAEDCFMGTYKGVKVIFSEARLYSKTQRDGPVFDGIFVLLETPEDVIDGHTVITANHKMMKAYEKTRWKTMNKVHVSVSNPDWDKFHIFSTKPEAAELIIGDRLLKELAEAADIFDDAPLTAALFGKKYIFMMIPYDKDMFEPSNMFVPVTTKSQALKCKHEIEQLLEIIDVFDLYEPVKT